jgi:hypothetical protein
MVIMLAMRRHIAFAWWFIVCELVLLLCIIIPKLAKYSSYLINISPNVTTWLATRGSTFRFYVGVNSLVGTTFSSTVNNMADSVTPVSLH